MTTPHHPPSSPTRPHQAMGAGGEFDTIRMLMSRWGDLAADIGDDAAVLSPITSGVRVVSTDACVEGVHFRREWIAPYDVGVRAAAAALSDLAAMGAAAEYVLVAFVVPDGWRTALGAVADGIGAQVRRAGARIVGGNLSRGAAFGITLTVIGTAARAVSRAGAQVGDVVVVTGLLGGPGAALAAWESGVEPTGWAHERFVHPSPRLAEGALLAAAGASAMLDISDGLAADARHIAAASGVDLVIDDTRLPLGEGITAQNALRSGEEYELLATMAPSAYEALACAWPAGGVSLTVIGVVGPIGAAHRSGQGAVSPGHDHFRENS
ncbi:MAG TPA: thiamine-phosphate kinase [Gemmatimonas aurantiaca]|uniref:Thiamine-monophosphate kinase n=2 Tax=Gemmatimonas aurantiaca TaxID=173480 RepID=C1A7Y1_GEMAT|nr:thiamine-phosphate kinase [Gemmatimonas aurantiaca]BAH38341.1 thiamine-monophosphate kinase [Gemmatimonas aurantiaca T-27]HCT57112.1 thiamine-phosphate kinase [Gemmatimonas aurantiaca]